MKAMPEAARAVWLGFLKGWEGPAGTSDRNSSPAGENWREDKMDEVSSMPKHWPAAWGSDT
jgi:hypothetical protein